MIEHKILPKTTKNQGLVNLGRLTFIDEIIWRFECQALVGPWKTFGKGYTISPLVAESPTTTHAKIHSQMEGLEQSFQDIPIKYYNPPNEGNSCNLKEGEGETSGRWI